MLCFLQILTIHILTLGVLGITRSPDLDSSLLVNSSQVNNVTLLDLDSLDNSSGTNATEYSASAIGAVIPTCFTQPNPDEPQLHSVIIDDCLEVLFEILRSPTALIPNAWDSRFRDFPVWNVFGTCAIGLVPRYQTSRDVFPELLVAHVAAVVTDVCVNNRLDVKVGGIAIVGARREFEVCVYGRDPSAVGIVGFPAMNGTVSL